MTQKETIITIIGIIIVAVLMFFAGMKYADIKATEKRMKLHSYCNLLVDEHNDNCRYEVGECPQPLCSHSKLEICIPRDYQIDLKNDTVIIYDGDRPVGGYVSNWKNQMDTILLNDNQ